MPGGYPQKDRGLSPAKILPIKRLLIKRKPATSIAGSVKSVCEVRKALAEKTAGQPENKKGNQSREGI